MAENNSSRTTREVLDHHIQSLARGSLEEVLEDYTGASRLVHMGGVVQGLEALRAFFADSIANTLPPDAEQTIQVKHVHGELAYIVWNADSRFYHIPFGTDTFVVRDGFIVMQTFAGILESKRREEAR